MSLRVGIDDVRAMGGAWSALTGSLSVSAPGEVGAVVSGQRGGGEGGQCSPGRHGCRLGRAPTDRRGETRRGRCRLCRQRRPLGKHAAPPEERVTILPTLTDLLEWPTDHLAEAAGYWVATGSRWYETFDRAGQDAASIDWEGDAAERLRGRTRSDRLKVSGLDDQLQHAAKVARMGASDLYAARSRLRYAVEDARGAGFLVGEDLSLTDRFAGGIAGSRTLTRADSSRYT